MRASALPRFVRLSALALAVVLPALACSPPRATVKALDAGARDAGTDASIVTVDRKAYPKVLNPPGPEGTLFYAGTGEGCHRAKSPRPEQLPDLTTVEAVSCPDALRDPAWNRCAGGVLFASVDSKKCVCAQSGQGGHAVEVPCPEVVKP